MWLRKSYPTQKPLLPYILDLGKRLEMFDRWISEGIPEVIWISGFYFTHSFIAGIKQNFARTNKYPYDRVDLVFEVLKITQSVQGTVITGLFLEGASWDNIG